MTPVCCTPLCLDSNQEDDPPHRSSSDHPTRRPRCHRSGWHLPSVLGSAGTSQIRKGSAASFVALSSVLQWRASP